MVASAQVRGLMHSASGGNKPVRAQGRAQGQALPVKNKILKEESFWSSLFCCHKAPPEELQKKRPGSLPRLVPECPIDHPFLDKFTGRHLGKRKCPGRGDGLCDKKGVKLKIWDSARFTDVRQGNVGNCWLLSAIASLAEHPGAVARLFQKNKNLANMPAAGLNKYIVTLNDLKTWQEVDVEVNESLCAARDGRLFGAKPSHDSELWVCILEKALAVHCGGWDNIHGGHCHHGWRLLTGYKDQYIILRGQGRWIMVTDTPLQGGMSNSAHGPARFREAPFPDGEKSKSDNEMFDCLCDWDKKGFLVAAGCMSGTRRGIVGGHAYSVLDCRSFNIRSTRIDLVKVANPWGHHEFQGKWSDNGSGWRDYPEIRDECKPQVKNDGIFWLSKEEFFKYFKQLYLCTQNIKQWGARFQDNDYLRSKR